MWNILETPSLRCLDTTERQLACVGFGLSGKGLSFLICKMGTVPSSIGKFASYHQYHHHHHHHPGAKEKGEGATSPGVCGAHTPGNRMVLILLLGLLFETGSHVAWAGLELTL